MIRLPAIGPVPALAIAGGLGAAITAMYLGFVPEWDLLNYHLYNPHALLTGRLGRDVAPAQIQSFLNPVFHIPHYLLFRYAAPEILVFVTGLVQGAQLALLFVLARRLVAPHEVGPVPLILIALLGIGGPIFFSELGGTQGDTLLSALVLGGLLLVLPDAPRHDKRRYVRAAGLAGALLGIATGLKLVFAIYAVALGVAVLVYGRSRQRWPRFLAYGGGALAGLLLAAGPWFVYLWAEYQSPLFPYFNEIFKSEWVGERSFRDLRFMPRSTLEWLAYPLVWLRDPLRVWEWPFRDLRMIALLPAALAALLMATRRMPQRLFFVATFIVVSYLLWLFIFSIYRYLAVLEMLAPIVLFALLVQWRPRRGVVLVGLALLLASQLAVQYTHQPALWELRADQPSAVASLPGNALVLIGGYAPAAFTALWLDDRVPLVRVRANFMRPEWPDSRMSTRARQRVLDHEGPVYILVSPGDFDSPRFARDLSELGLIWDGVQSCRPVFADQELQRRLGLQICRLRSRKAWLQIADRVARAAKIGT